MRRLSMLVGAAAASLVWWRFAIHLRDDARENLDGWAGCALSLNESTEMLKQCLERGSRGTVALTTANHLIELADRASVAYARGDVPAAVIAIADYHGYRCEHAEVLLF